MVKRKAARQRGTVMGSGAEIRAAVLAYLRTRPGELLPVWRIAGNIGRGDTAVRHHLAALVADGIVEDLPRNDPGARGFHTTARGYRLVSVTEVG